MVKSDGFVMGRRGALRVLGGMAAGLGVGASVQAQTAGGAGGLGSSALQLRLSRNTWSRPCNTGRGAPPAPEHQVGRAF